MLTVVVASTALAAPPAASGAAGTRLALDRLNVLGSVLMIGAHPDDENTALLAYLARGRKLRTAYLSLTRGEGGQNLIGSEQGELMGILRTQELLAARALDGAGQYFSRAIDFGYSKTAEETLAEWGRDEILSDVVWVIRSFRPDVIVLRFSGTPRDGHGHHQSSAILGVEAFHAAADRNRFPEQLQWVEPWQAKRVVHNIFAFSPEQRRAAAKNMDFEIEIGDYDPLLGYSYGEIAGMSRSMHRSQGMGAAQRRGPIQEMFSVAAGEKAQGDLMEGIDTTWARVPDASEAARLLREAAQSFDTAEPAKVVPLLARARSLLASDTHPWAVGKREELDEAITLAAGLWLDASAAAPTVVPGGALKIEVVALNRSRLPVTLAGVRFEGHHPPSPDLTPAELAYNTPLSRSLEWKVPASHPYSQPYWLRLPRDGSRYSVPDQRQIGLPVSAPVLQAVFRLRVGSENMEVERPVHHRYVDPVRGELTRPLEVAPPVALRLPPLPLVFPGSDSRAISVQVSANRDQAEGEMRLAAPDGWRVTPASRPFRLAGAGEQTALEFRVSPPAAAGSAALEAAAALNPQHVSRGMIVLDYPHIPPQTVFPAAQTGLVRLDVKVLARKVGYVMGAGDDVPEALRQLGCQVTLLSPEHLAGGDLSVFDAIVTGVRAYNVRPDLKANQQRLLDYVHKGGTLVVQYNVLEGGFTAGDPESLARIGPYPLRVGRARVSVEEAPVRFLQSGHPILESPNRITSQDFEGWVQERGLYFAAEWDPQYQPLFELHDPGEPPLQGSTLYARHGRGVYVFTALSWFRQLPAGVPGAYRIFANLISAGKSIP